MKQNYEIDKLDRQILTELQKDSRKPFQDIARKLVVSGGTIHVRFNKMREAGLIRGSRILIDHGRLGYDVVAFIGLNLHQASDHERVVSALQEMNEVLEVHYTTGSYSLFIKVLAESTKGLHQFLVEKLQKIPEIQSTETLISLDMPVHRDVRLLDD